MRPREKAFALRMIAGDEPSQAYLAAEYAPLRTPRLVSIAAQRLLHRPHIAAMIEKSKRNVAARAEMTREDKLRRLEEKIRSGKLPDRDAIKAIEVHNVMTGHNAPAQVNVFGLSDLLNLVRKKSK